MPKKSNPQKRTVQTVYYSDLKCHKKVKLNHAKYANQAVLHAVHHMQQDTYRATIAEVYDSRTGVLYAVIRRNTRGIVIVYKRDIIKGE